MFMDQLCVHAQNIHRRKEGAKGAITAILLADTAEFYITAFTSLCRGPLEWLTKLFSTFCPSLRTCFWLIAVLFTLFHSLYPCLAEHPPGSQASDQRADHHCHCTSTFHSGGRGWDPGAARWPGGGAGDPLWPDGQPSQRLPRAVAQAECSARLQGCGRESKWEWGRGCDRWKEFHTSFPMRVDLLGECGVNQVQNVGGTNLVWSVECLCCGAWNRQVVFKHAFFFFFFNRCRESVYRALVKMGQMCYPLWNSS